jgi:hypothetical protein
MAMIPPLIRRYYFNRYIKAAHAKLKLHRERAEILAKENEPYLENTEGI